MMFEVFCYLFQSVGSNALSGPTVHLCRDFGPSLWNDSNAKLPQVPRQVVFAAPVQDHSLRLSAIEAATEARFREVILIRRVGGIACFSLALPEGLEHAVPKQQPPLAPTYLGRVGFAHICVGRRMRSIGTPPILLGPADQLDKCDGASGIEHSSKDLSITVL
jgi:hypothetical protein